MQEVVKFGDSLKMFQNIVLLYRNKEGRTFIGNVYFYDSRGRMDYLAVLCKDPLPEEEGLMMGWNWLDDNSPHINLVPEESMETGVEDFLYANGLTRDWKSVDYYVIPDFTALEPYLEEHPLEDGGCIAFGILR